MRDAVESTGLILFMNAECSLECSAVLLRYATVCGISPQPVWMLRLKTMSCLKTVLRHCWCIGLRLSHGLASNCHGFRLCLDLDSSELSGS